MAGLGGIGTGFFKKMSSIQDENRKQENEFMLEDLKSFNEGLKVYRANKAEQQKLDNQARGFALQISGDPRDTKALDVARTFISGGYNISDPITLKSAQQQYADMKLKETQSQAQATASAQAAPNGDNPQAQAGTPTQGTTPQAQAAPMAGNVPSANVQGQPQQPAQAPGLGNGLFKKDVTASNLFTGKSTPEQYQQKSIENISARTGMTPEQVQAIRSGQDTGKTDFNPSSTGAPMDAGKAMLISNAMKLAADPGKLTDPAKFWQAVGSGNYEEAGKYIANAQQQNQWHIDAAKIQAAATLEGHKISAGATVQAAEIHERAAKATRDATIAGSPAQRYADAAAKLDATKEAIKADPSMIAEFAKQFPGIDMSNPQTEEWIALQVLKKTDTEAYSRVIAGPNNKPPQGVNTALDPRTASTPPGYKAGANDPGKGGSKTDPYAGKDVPKDENTRLKAVSDAIKNMPEGADKDKVIAEFNTKYGDKKAKKYGLGPKPIEEPNKPSTGEDKSVKSAFGDVKPTKAQKELNSTVSDAQSLIDSGIEFEKAVKEAMSNAKKEKRNVSEDEVRKALKK